MAKNKIIKSLELIEKWELQGLSQKDIAQNLGVHPRTLREFKRKNPSLFSSFSNEESESSGDVELALLKCALGYEFQEEVPVKVKEEVIDTTTNQILIKERVIVKKVTKWVKADLNAQRYWLNNRKYFGWKDNPHKVNNDIEMLEIRRKELEAKEF